MTEPEQPIELTDATQSDAPQPQPLAEATKATPASPAKPYRLSDAERSTAISALGDAYAEGRLDAEEFGVRMSTATEAKLATDLAGVFADLPHQEPEFLAKLLKPEDPERQSKLDARRAARAHRASRAADRSQRRIEHNPRPLMMMPLIVLILAATNMWFFLPLLFICMSMSVRGGHQRRDLGCGPGAARALPHPTREKGL